MKIAIIGASGFIGHEILNEALQRGHQVTAIVRNPEKITVSNDNLIVKKADVTDANAVAEAISGTDAVISAYKAVDTDTYVQATKATIAGLKQAGIKRFILVSGAASLEVAPGHLLLDSPHFPAEWKPIAEATRAGLLVLRQENDLDWTAVIPAAMIEPGPRTGKFRVGTTSLVTDEAGNSKISVADYAVALVDELETPKHVKQQFTVAY
ncbi:NAD(P)-dependent oxidoreductase [Chitinophaga sp. sic0106]|uniref:NAD(P)-dependent oxidoreductase n=1 Tax=Chitinophaga sp. sic0106 TaxID=2854785 RepID=UPI001C45CBAA|nr:NAD(P)-dependent oxidoreductase [Chitinophaga sp. sic0106]MBV7529381.1 NAD(P)-dependent oxidoreductase [Chitinophaga sp. sic0106]